MATPQIEPAAGGGLISFGRGAGLGKGCSCGSAANFELSTPGVVSAGSRSTGLRRGIGMSPIGAATIVPVATSAP